jgi:hypothetical protein
VNAALDALPKTALVLLELRDLIPDDAQAEREAVERLVLTLAAELEHDFQTRARELVQGVAQRVALVLEGVKRPT